MCFKNRDGFIILKNLIKEIQRNKDLLSEIDGKIGDGDHGINMNKGVSLCESRIAGKDFTMSEGFDLLSQILMTEIGGSMGPLYGIFFGALAEQSMDYEVIDEFLFLAMITTGAAEIQELGGAKRGDKTLLDTLVPALEAYDLALNSGKSFYDSLEDFKLAAKEGCQSTESMIARIGRASRLGERSRGVLDAGATSCYLILNSIATTVQSILQS
jgi:phosphoenolpyruvate---glycerone phosphotransferase subunit DhaL